MTKQNQTSLTSILQSSKKRGNLHSWYGLKALSVIGVETLEQFEALIQEQQPQGEKGWKSYLLQLLLLPEFMWKKYQLLPETGCEEASTAVLVLQQAYLVIWLDYLVPGNKPFNPILSRELKGMESRARYSKSMLDLAVCIHQKFPEMRQNDAPTDLWITWEVQLFHDQIMGSGLITGKPEQSPSKSKQVDKARKALKLLDEPQKIDFTPGERTCGAGEAIVIYATRLAAQDKTFRYSKTWTGFKSAYRAWLRSMRGKDFSEMAFERGELLPSGRNAKRTPNKVGKDL